MKAAIKGNRFLSSYVHNENDIAFGLERCGDLIARYGGLPDTSDATRKLYPAVTFAAQTLSMMDLATPAEAERLRRRVAGSFDNPNDMRAMRLELTTATHFARRGYRLEWPEMTPGAGTFDLLVPDMGPLGAEVECKSVSNDKGRNVHRRDALVFHHLVAGELAHIRKTLKIGLSAVLTIPGSLPTRHADREALAKRVKQQITIGHSARFEDGSELRITEFDMARLGNVANDNRPEVVRPIIESITGTQNREAMLTGTDAGGALAFVVQSAVTDDFMEATFRTLGNAGRRQLTGTRPGILIAGFDGLDSDQLVSIAGQDHDPNRPPTALAMKVSAFLSSENRDSIVGVGFLSRGALRPPTDGIVDSGGTAYYFPKRESSLWSEDFRGLFTPPS